jgi:hypothetical protein
MNISTKKIIVVVLTVLFVVFALYVLINMRTSSQQTVAIQESAVQTIPTLPEAQISPSPDLGAVKKSTQDELINVQRLEKQISEKNYKDSTGKIISLNDFAKANGIKIESGVLQDTSQKDYATFSCANDKSGRPAIGLVIQLRRDVDPKKYQQLYPEMEKNMKDWEGAIFQDLSPLFFPGESFDAKPAFSEAKYTTSNKANIISIRFANLIAVSGKQYSIDWGALNDQFFVSNDKNCLRQELDKNADAYEP